MKRFLSLLCCVVMAASLVGCGEAPGGNGEELTISALRQQTELSAAEAGDADQATLLLHLYENLLKWENDGTGHAVTKPGMAQSYTTQEETSGGVTYTFTLRAGAKWSDGTPVKAGDFVAAWQNLFNRESIPSLLWAADMVEGFSEAAAAKDGSLLTGVFAPNDTTLVISLTEPCAYFLDVFCAGAMTLPVREDLAAMDGTVTNGLYTLTSLDSTEAVMTRSETYYDQTLTGPKTLTFRWTEEDGDWAGFEKGEVQFIDSLPVEALETLSDDESLMKLTEPTVDTLLLNTTEAPFDDLLVRQAFALAVTSVDFSDGVTTADATGLVPAGITNRDDLWQPETAEGETPITYWDYRTVGDSEYPEDMTPEERVETAQMYLSQAGYPDGKNFPEVTYLYLNTEAGQAAAKKLRETLQETLSIPIELKACTEEELRENLLAGTYTMGSFQFTAAYDDATAFLNRWVSTIPREAGNLVQFNDRAYDLLLYAAEITSSLSGREACLHDAEALLMKSGAVIPLTYGCETAALSRGLTGVYTSPLGIYFFGSVTPAT